VNIRKSDNYEAKRLKKQLGQEEARRKLLKMILWLACQEKTYQRSLMAN